MTLGQLGLAVWLILVGVSWAIIPISALFLGIWALVVGILLIIEGVGIWSQPLIKR